MEGDFVHTYLNVHVRYVSRKKRTWEVAEFGSQISLSRRSRAGNSGGTREPSSQKEFGFAESFFDFEIFTELNSKKFLNLLPKLFLLHRLYQFLWHTHDFLF